MKTETNLAMVPADADDNEDFGCAEDAMVLLPETVKEIEVGYVRRSK